MALWDREAVEKEGLERQQAERRAEMKAQQVIELACAKERADEWHKQDEESFTRDARQREELEKAREEQLVKVAEANAKARLEAEESMRAEQVALNAERVRQEAIRAARKPVLHRPCATDDKPYTWEEGMEKRVRMFRQIGTSGDTLIIKLDKELNMLQIEESIKGISVEDLAEQLEGVSSPRYVLYIHEHKHADGRTQLPIAFILFMPPSVPVDLKVLYTRPVMSLVNDFKVNKHFSLDDADTLDVTWLDEQLGFRRG